VTAYQYPPAASPYPEESPADPTAVMARRSIAWIIDVLLFFLVASFFGPTPLSPFALYEEVPSGFDYGEACEQLMKSDEVAACTELGDRAYYIDGTDALVASLVTIAYFLLIPGLLQGLKGFTPGKGLLGVRCVDEQGQAPGIGKALARSVLWIVDGAPYVIPLVAPATAFTSKGHRRVGDMAAKTFVIGKADMGRPVIVPGVTTAYAAGYGIRGGYRPPGHPGQPGPAPWDQPAPGAPTPGGWGAPVPPPGAAAPPPGAAGQPWGAPAPQGSPWAPPSTPSGSPTPSGGWPSPGGGPAPSTTPSGESPATPGGATPSGESPAATPGGATPSGESPAATPGGAIPLGAVGSTSPSTESAPSGETPSTAPSSGSGAPPSGQPSGPSDTPRETTAPSGAAATPSSGSPSTAGAAGAQQQAGSGYEPQWDAARNTYILWEPNRRQWLGWDDSAKEWRPL
jgi:uncharacterized RDD family membrane protein YckC